MGNQPGPLPFATFEITLSCTNRISDRIIEALGVVPRARESGRSSQRPQ